MSSRFSIHVSLNLIVSRQNSAGETEVLLQLRQNTGYMDGNYDFACSGHLEKGETLEEAVVREAKEEINITLTPDEVKLVLTAYDAKEAYAKFVFLPTVEIKATPKIMEPDKCGDLRWFNTKALPENIRPFVRDVVKEVVGK